MSHPLRFSNSPYHPQQLSNFSKGKKSASFSQPDRKPAIQNESKLFHHSSGILKSPTSHKKSDRQVTFNFKPSPPRTNMIKDESTVGLHGNELSRPHQPKSKTPKLNQLSLIDQKTKSSQTISNEPPPQIHLRCDFTNKLKTHLEPKQNPKHKTKLQEQLLGNSDS